MLAVIQPIVLVVSFDLEKDFPLQILLAPVTITWVFLIIAIIYLWAKVMKYYKKVKTICDSQPHYAVPVAPAW